MQRLALTLAGIAWLGAAPATGTDAALSRLLYVTDATGISVYDIDRGHAFVREIAIPNTGTYKGIGASAQLGLLYVTSNRGDELIALSLATDSVVWRKNVGKYADSFWVTPDGREIWMPLRGEITWKALDPATGTVLGQVETERGARYDVDPIADIGPPPAFRAKSVTGLVVSTPVPGIRARLPQYEHPFRFHHRRDGANGEANRNNQRRNGANERRSRPYGHSSNAHGHRLTPYGHRSKSYAHRSKLHAHRSKPYAHRSKPYAHRSRLHGHRSKP